jgi:predicted NBD/HSP70 family sugar kinase
VTTSRVSGLLACVEVGGGSVQTVLFDADDYSLHGGALQPPGAALAIAVPGLIDGELVAEASNLGWRNTDPVVALGLRGPALVVVNDAEAASLGEAALRGARGLAELVFVGVGTGVGGAVVRDARVVAGNLFGHGSGFGDSVCRCGRSGCLETVAGGWALPEPITRNHLEDVATAIAVAIGREPQASGGPVVVGGGITRRYPQLVRLLADRLPERRVEASLAPARAKSAAAWGLRRLVDDLTSARISVDGEDA